MASKDTISLLSLHKDEVSLILNKIPISDLKLLSQTCSAVKNLIEVRKNALASRPSYGIDLYLFAQLDDVTFSRGPYNSGKIIDEKFFENIAYTSISKLEIALYRTFLGPKVLEIVKKWKPVCKSVTINGVITRDVIEMIDYFQCSRCIELTFNANDNFRLIEDLEKTVNHDRIYLNMNYDNITIFETLRHFYGFRINATADRLLQFLLDFQEAKEPHNLQKFSFNIDLPINSYYNDQSLNDLLPDKDLPPTEFLFAANKLEESGWKLNTVRASRFAGTIKPSRIIAKLPLKDNMCAIIHDTNEYSVYLQPQKKIKVAIMEDDEDGILDHLLQTFSVNNQVYTYEKRQEYFGMDEYERLQEMRRLYFEKRRNDREKAREQARERNRIYN